MKKYFLFVLVVQFIAVNGFADITNGGFESDFTGWTQTANNRNKTATATAVASLGSVTPQAGSKMAQIQLGKNGADVIDFNFLHSSTETIGASDHVKLKLKIAYNNLIQTSTGTLMEIILAAPKAGQPLIATIGITDDGTKSRVTNIMAGTTSEVAIISSGDSGYDKETEWLTIDIDVSSYSGISAPISFFINGGDMVDPTESVYYLIDDVKLEP